MGGLDRNILFVGLTKPQMFAGVTYAFVVLNAVATTELFLLLKSPWILLAAVAFHVVGWFACLGEPRIFDIWLAKTSQCPRTRTWSIWRCNAYRP